LGSVDDKATSDTKQGKVGVARLFIRPCPIDAPHDLAIESATGKIPHNPFGTMRAVHHDKSLRVILIHGGTTGQVTIGINNESLNHGGEILRFQEVIDLRELVRHFRFSFGGVGVVGDRS
jgi:hypothetical protein